MTDFKCVDRMAGGLAVLTCQHVILSDLVLVNF